MKKYKEWLPVAGMTVILLMLSLVLFFSVRDQPDPRRTPETTTVMKKEDKDESTTKGSKQQTEKTDEGNSIKVYGISHLYYLDLEGGQTFERRLTRFLTDQKMDAGSAEVMDYHIDDRKQESEPAQFFLKLDDSRHTIVRVSFKKTKGTYRFDLYDGPVPDGMEDSSEEEEHEIPESTEDVAVPKSRISITDPEGQLKDAADMKELKKELEGFLRSEEEGRRNFYVRSVTVTGKEYKAVLYFETVRQDGRNVEVRYDGKYHFRFI